MVIPIYIIGNYIHIKSASECGVQCVSSLNHFSIISKMGTRFRLIAAFGLLLLIWCQRASGRSINGLAKLHRRHLAIDLHPPAVSAAELGPTVRLSASSIVAAPAEIDAPSLLKINTLMLLFYSTLGSVMPYFPLYYKKLGITGEDVLLFKLVLL